MPERPVEIPVESAEKSEEKASAGFMVNFVAGRGLLTMRERPLGPFEIHKLELDIPHLKFPFDVTGGAKAFKSHRCVFKELTLKLDEDGLNKILNSPSLANAGFRSLHATIQDGFVELSGYFGLAGESAAFTMRAAWVIADASELDLVFWESQIFGPHSISAALLPTLLSQALNLPFIKTHSAAIWRFTPTRSILMHLLVKDGWKLPETAEAKLISVRSSQGEIILRVDIADDAADPTPANLAPPPEALTARDSMLLFAPAEQALADGDLALATQLYRDSVDDERGGRWAKQRFLELASIDPQLAFESGELSTEILAQTPGNTVALLTLANQNERQNAHQEAAKYYDSVASFARTQNNRSDFIAAKLAVASTLLFEEPQSAIAALEEVVARAHDHLPATHSLFQALLKNDKPSKTVAVGERLLHLEQDPLKKTHIHSTLGTLYLTKLEELKKARIHFERALRLDDDCLDAIDGLAKVYAQHKETDRVSTYLNRLAELAEKEVKSELVSEIHLRIGRIREFYLGNKELATEHYRHATDADTSNKDAHLHLARAEWARGARPKSRQSYENYLALTESSAKVGKDDAEVYLEVAKLYRELGGLDVEIVAALERGIELDTKNVALRDRLISALEEQSAWRPLSQALADAADITDDKIKARDYRVWIAALASDKLNDPGLAEVHLRGILEVDPQDYDATELLAELFAKSGRPYEAAEVLSSVALTHEDDNEIVRWLLGAEFFLTTAKASWEERRELLVELLKRVPQTCEAAERLVQGDRKSKNDVALAESLKLACIAADNKKKRSQYVLELAELLSKKLDRRHEAIDLLREEIGKTGPHPKTSMALAQLLFADNDAENALTILKPLEESSIEDSSQRISFHRLYAAVAEKSEDWATLETQIRAVLKESPDDQTSSNRLITALGAQKDYQGLAKLREAQAEYGAPYESQKELMAAADAWRQAENNPQAVRHYQNLLQHEKYQLPAATALLELSKESGNKKDQLASIQILIERSDEKDLPPWVRQKMDLLAESGDLEGADACAEILVQQAPADSRLRYYLGGRCLMQQKFAEGLSHYLHILDNDQTQDLSSTELENLFQKSTALAADLEPMRAIDLAKDFISAFPETPLNILEHSFSKTLEKEERFEELLRLRQEELALRHDSASADLHYVIGDILFKKLGRAKESLPFFQDVVAADPNNINAREALVAVLGHLDNSDELAKVLFGLSQLVEGSDGFDYGLRAARVYRDQVHDSASADQVLEALSALPWDPELAWEELLVELRTYSRDNDRLRILEQLVHQYPDPESPYFDELNALLREDFEDPERAKGWCTRMIEAFPDVDKPRKLLLENLRSDQKLEEAQLLLSDWAENRTGEERSEVLLEEAAVWDLLDNKDEIQRCLNEAALAAKESQNVRERLINWHTGRSEWAETTHWLWDLSNLVGPQKEKDEILRRIVELSTDYTNDSQSALKALSEISELRKDEQILIIQLKLEDAELGDLDEFVNLSTELDDGSLIILLSRLIQSNRDNETQPFIQEMFRRYPDGNFLEQLRPLFSGEEGKTRLAQFLVAIAEEVQSPMLRVKWRTEALLHYDEFDQGCESAVELRANLSDEWAGISEFDNEMALLLFQAALEESHASLRHRAANEITQDDSADHAHFNDALLFSARHTFTAGDYDKALEYVGRLSERRDPRADELRIEIFNKAGRLPELIQALEEKRSKEGHDTEELRRHLVGLYSQTEQYINAGEILSLCPPERQDMQWAELAAPVAKHLQDEDMLASAWIIQAETEEDPLQKARTLRNAGRIKWWAIGDESLGKELLKRSFELVSWNEEKLLQKIKGQNTAEATQRLEEGLFLFEASSAPHIWIEAARREVANDNPAAAKPLLEDALTGTPGNADASMEIAELAKTLDLTELRVKAASQAFDDNENFAGALDRAYEAAGRPSDRVQLLVKIAGNMEATQAGMRYEMAAQIALDELQAPGLSLELLELGLKVAPSFDILLRAFNLAGDVERFTLQAALAEPLLRRTENDNPARHDILRTYAGTLRHLGLVDELAEIRSELISLGIASYEEMVNEARFQAERDPEKSARILLGLGIESYTKEDYSTAASHLSEAWTIFPLPETLSELEKTWFKQDDKSALTSLYLGQSASGTAFWQGEELGRRLAGAINWAQEDQDQDQELSLLRAIRALGLLSNEQDDQLMALTMATNDSEGAIQMMREKLAKVSADEGAALAASYANQIRTSLVNPAALIEFSSRAFLGAANEENAKLLFSDLKACERENEASGFYRQALSAASDENKSALLKILTPLLKTVDAESWRGFMHESAHLYEKSGDSAAALKIWITILETGLLDLLAIQHGFRLARSNQQSDLQQRIIGFSRVNMEAVPNHIATLRDHERTLWAILCAHAFVAEDRLAEAQIYFEEALKAQDEIIFAEIVDPLSKIYAARELWHGVITLRKQQAAYSEDTTEKSQLLFEVAGLWQTKIQDENKALDAFRESLRHAPENPEVKLATGLLLAKKHIFVEALDYLQDVISIEAGTNDQLRTLLECYKQTGDTENTLSLLTTLLEKNPDSPGLLLMQAQILDSTGQADSAWDAWGSYLASGDEEIEEFTVRQRLSELALQQGKTSNAIEQLEAASKLKPSDVHILQELRELYESIQDFENAVNIRWREAELEASADDKILQYRALVTLYRDHLQDQSGVSNTLERIAELRPGDLDLLQELFLSHTLQKDWTNILVVGERILALFNESDLDSDFLKAMGLAYKNAAEDPIRAQDFFSRAYKKNADDSELVELFLDAAEENSDWQVVAELRKKSIDAIEESAQRAVACSELADFTLKKVRDTEKTLELLLEANQLAPENHSIMRTLADVYALDAKHYPSAFEVYRELLDVDPSDQSILRIVARLAGQIGDNDRAYGYYSALLTLQTDDEEAKRFVDACRLAAVTTPTRKLASADRLAGLVAPGLSSVIDNFFVPLARFAELIRPSALSHWDVEEQDKMSENDPIAKLMRTALDLVDLGDAPLYLWRDGGFACDLVAGKPPSILIGTDLFMDASTRQRSFLTLRQAELYKRGHLLCDTIDTASLGALSNAMLSAVLGEDEVPLKSDQAKEWHETLKTRMTDPTRAAMLNAAQALSSTIGLDMGAWREAALQSANRTALLVAGDIQEAMSALLRLRSLDVTDISTNPETLDLLRFSLSSPYFEIRKVMGVALRESQKSAE